MKKNKLLTILRTFSKEELKSFGKFIDSPYFSTGRNLKPLYNILKKIHPDYNKGFTEEKIYRILHPRREFNRKKASLNMRVLYSDMAKLAAKFVYFEHIERGEFNYFLSMGSASAFEQKLLNELSINELLKCSQQIELKEKTEEYFFQRLITNQALSKLYVKNNKLDLAVKQDVNNILYIYAFLFHNLANYLNNRFVRNFTHNEPVKGIEMAKQLISSFDPELFMKECDDDQYRTKYQTILNYFLIKSRMNENDPAPLLKGLTIYYKIYDNFSDWTNWNNFIKLYNRFVGRVNLDQVYSEKICELFDFAWKNGLFENLKKINIGLFPYLNVLQFKSRLLTYRKLRSFIISYSEHFPPETRSEIQNYSMSFYFFKRGMFEKCLSYTSTNSVLDDFYKPYKYKLKIASLFELKYLEEALYAAMALKQFLRRKKEMGPLLRNKCNEFITIVQFLLANHSTEKLKSDVYNLDIVYNKFSFMGDWLENKINELKNLQKRRKVS